MKSKLKTVIPFAVLAISCGIAAGCNGCNNHEHDYTEWGYNETQHWKQCPEDKEKDNGSVANHGKPNADGKCPECDYQLVTHNHAYTEWGYSVTHHWKQCPDDKAIDSSTKVLHSAPNEKGQCPDCGYQVKTYVDQQFEFVLRKDGVNTALTSIEDLTLTIARNDDVLVENTHYKVEKSNGVLTIKNIESGSYTFTVLTADGEYRYSDIVKFDGSAQKELVLQFNYAMATSQAYYVDLTHMNDEDRVLLINTSGVDDFWQWNSSVAEITLNLEDSLKNSAEVKLEFKLKATNPNNKPNNAFGIVMTESYKGAALSLWDTVGEDDGVKLHNIVGKKLGNDAYSADGEATLKWLETAIYGESGVEIRAVRSGNTVSFFAKKDGKWIAFKSLACPEADKTDIRFMGAGSDYAISDIVIDGEYKATAQNFTANVSVKDGADNAVTLPAGAKGLLIAGDTRYEVNLSQQGDKYTFSGNFVPGSYTFSILGKTNGYSSAALQLDDSPTAEIALIYGDYATATRHEGDGIQLADRVTVTDGNISIDGVKSGDDGFWQWRTGAQSSNVVPAATLNLSDEIKSSRKVTVDFKLKATNPNNLPNNAFGIAMTEFHNGAAFSFWDTKNENNGIACYALKGTWLGEDGWEDDKLGTHKWLETAIYGNGAFFRVERDGKNIKINARNGNEWVTVFETECYEYAETMVKFMGIGSEYEISGIRVRVPNEGETSEFDVTASFAGESHGYSITVDPVVEEGDSAELIIETTDAEAARGYFPNAITVNGKAIDFSAVERVSIGVNKVRYTYIIEGIMEDQNIVVTVAEGVNVGYSASVNDKDMGSIVCDREAEDYYWNDECTLTITAQEGHRLNKLVFGEGEGASEVTEGWTKDGFVYTYKFKVTGDIKVTAQFEATPLVSLNDVKINIVDADENKVIVNSGAKLMLDGDYHCELTLTANEDGTYSTTGKVYEGEYSFAILGDYLGYDGVRVEVMSGATSITLKLGKIAKATEYHHGDHNGMGECDFETLIEVNNDNVKINTAKVNNKIVDSFWCWGSQVPEVSLTISEEVKKSTNVQIEFNLKAENSNDGPNNAFGIVMTEGYKGINISLWDATNAMAYYPLDGNVLGNNDYSGDKCTSDKWLETLIRSDSGANIRAIRNGEKITFFAENEADEWIKIFETNCAADAKTDIKFLGMGSDYTISSINIVLPEEAVNITFDETVENGEFGLGADKYFLNEECTVIVTAKDGYTLKSLTIGEGENALTVTEGFIKNGLEYSYSFILTGDVKISAEFEEIPMTQVSVEVTVTDGTANVDLGESVKAVLVGDTESEVTLTKTTDGTYLLEGEFLNGNYKLYLADKTVGYTSADVIIAKEDPTESVTITFLLATATKYHHGDNNGMGACDFETLIEVNNDNVKINTAKANDKIVDSFWCWGSQVPEVSLTISEGVKKAANVQLDFNLKAENSNNGPNNAFGIAMTEGYKGINISFWDADNAMAYYPLGGNVLGNNAYGGDKCTSDKWLETLIRSDSGANIRAIRNSEKITFFAKNAADEWLKIFETTCDKNAKTDVKFLGMGSDYTVSEIDVSVLESDVIQGDFNVTTSFAEDVAQGYTVTVDKKANYFTDEAGSATFTITGGNWGYFVTSIKIGEREYIADATKSSVSAGKCKYTFTVEDITADLAIVVKVEQGTAENGYLVDYEASVNDETMGEIKCDMESADYEYYWNDNCTLTMTAKEGYELEKLVIGAGDEITEVPASSCNQDGKVYTYSFTVTGAIKVVAHFALIPDANVTVKVTAKDYDGTTALELAEGTEITFVSSDKVNVYTYTVGGSENPGKMAIGTYNVTCYGFADTTVTVSEEGGEITVGLQKVIAYSSSEEITIDSANGTIAIKGNGAADRTGHREISADYVLTEEQQNSETLTLTFKVKSTDFNPEAYGNDEWAANRFGLQLGSGEIGFFLFLRDTSSSDVVKLIPGSLDLNPNSGEQKWHDGDSALSWINAAVQSDGLNVKVVRADGVIRIYAQNGSEWIRLDEGGTAGDLTIDAGVKNEIKFLAGGNSYTFSDITVSTTVEGQAD